MGKYIIAFDLGTGGNKSVLYDIEGQCLARKFVPYPTQYPASGWHEQRPMDWWQAVVQSTRGLLAETGIDPGEVECCGISGHSLGVVPLDKEGRLLREATPIWSDSRPTVQPAEFFARVREEDWYFTTGNGFPPPLYSVFKIMWYRDHEPEMFDRIATVIGTKDFINFKLTGRLVTDHSYASGSGVYDLKAARYSDRLIQAGALPAEIFPDIVPSTEVIGTLIKAAAEELGLTEKVRVTAGGVDNSCMALGGRAFKEGRICNALGSSSWMAVSSSTPLLDLESRPYVFAHILPGMFASAIGVFSTGTTFNWIRDQVFRGLTAEAGGHNDDVFEQMFALAGQSPPGANQLIFNPTMGGGSSVDPTPNIRGGYLGLDLGHTRADLIRAAMEGIAMALRLALDELGKLTRLGHEIVVVGGGNRSPVWRQIYADIYEINVVKTSVDQEVSALGAAAAAAVGTGLWPDFENIDEIHGVEDVSRPNPETQGIYRRLLPIYLKAREHLGELGDMIAELNE